VIGKTGSAKLSSGRRMLSIAFLRRESLARAFPRASSPLAAAAAPVRAFRRLCRVSTDRAGLDSPTF
jgi:hypothetical protein